MKLTKSKLQKLIKEELKGVLQETWPWERKLVPAPDTGPQAPALPMGSLCEFGLRHGGGMLETLKNAFVTAGGPESWEAYAQNNAKGMFVVYRGVRRQRGGGGTNYGDPRGRWIQFAVAPSIDKPLFWKELSVTHKAGDLGNFTEKADWVWQPGKTLPRGLVADYWRAVKFVEHWHLSKGPTGLGEPSEWKHSDVKCRTGPLCHGNWRTLFDICGGAAKIRYYPDPESGGKHGTIPAPRPKHPDD